MVAAAVLLAGAPLPATSLSPDVAQPVTQSAGSQVEPTSAPAPAPETGTQAVAGPSADAAPAPPPVDATPAAAPSDADQGAAIVVTGRLRNPGDPLEGANLKSFEVTQKVDDAITAPLAHGYEHAVPSPMRGGIRNFLGNLHEPVVFVNFLLQHKVGKAAETVGRFAINTTIGVAGFIDVARRKPFHLPRRPNGFADTLGFYGVKPGAYLFLPLMGPTTVRDLAGGLLDRLLLPAIPGTPFRGPTWTVPTGVLHTLDKRIQFDEKMAQQRTSDDPYTARRDYYLRQRQAEIDALHGKTIMADGAVPAAAAAPNG